jgi:hypothetical protein
LAIPAFRDDGYLPVGVHPCTEPEVTFRFGSQGQRRRRLIVRLRRWIELGCDVGASRLLVDGSFVTAKLEPKDIDAVMLLPSSYADSLANGVWAAIELDEMFVTRQPEELFPAENELIWNEWCDFFSQTREIDRRCKGIIEVML